VTRAPGIASRAAAERRADALLSQRAERFEQRERELRGLITNYHHATEQAAKLRADADARAARILANAEAKAAALRERANKDAAGREQAAATAVRAMLELGESFGTVQELTGLPGARVRQLGRATAAPKPASPNGRSRRPGAKTSHAA
jgi:hypothetical protein